MEAFWYLGFDTVMRLHEELLHEFGGASGVRDPGVIESAIESPKQGFDDQDLYPTIFDKASCYAYQLSQGQGFVDGNKRIAITCALVFLEINNHSISEDFDDELYDALIGVAERKIDREELSDIFRELHIKTIGLSDQRKK
jgi:death-on-curing protein